MNKQQLISELRNALQGTTFKETLVDGTIVRTSEYIVNDPLERKELTTKYVELLKSIEPTE